MTILVRQTSASASEASIRNHRVVVDRPTDKGGSDTGPMGGELFLAAIGGCFMSNLLAAINVRQSPVTNVETSVEGIIEGSPAHFVGVELSVSADCSDPDLLAKLVEVADRGCIMMNTLRGSLEMTIRIAIHA